MTSGLFSLGRSFYSSLSWGPTVSIAFWSKFSPFDFNRDFAACLIFLPHGFYSAIRKRTTGGDTSL
jgi:hypothetical protein